MAGPGATPGCATRLTGALALALVISACGKSQGEQFIDSYAGEPYTGVVDVLVEPAEGGKPWKQDGTGSAHFTANGDGTVRLVVFGAIDEEAGDAGFSIDGTFENGRWKSETDGVSIEMSNDGRIAGGGTIHPQRFGFSGSATETQFLLDVDIELLEGSPQSLPRGSMFRFSYDLSRAAPVQEEDEENDKNGSASVEDAGSRAKGKEKCRKIRYEMRPVANIGDGTMSMIQVPVCLK